MLITFTNKIKKEYNDYSVEEKLFIAFMMICSFCITAEAAITRNVSNSIFIQAYTAKYFPYAWIASMPLNWLVVSFYNQFIQKFGCKKMMGITLFFTFIFNIFCALYLRKIAYLPFILYLWKDTFIMFMFHNLWSVMHSTVNIRKAKYLYGLFFGFGGIGSFVGNIIPGLSAISIGTEKLLFITLPFYTVTYLFYAIAINKREQINSSENIENKMSDGNIFHGIRLIKNSQLLKFILSIVIFMQLSSTLIDYQFSILLENNFPIMDIRTAFTGKLFTMVSSINLIFQFFGTAILIKTIGLKNIHSSTPLILLFSTCMCFIFPSFFIISMSYTMVKSLDYSIFSIVKEMLYLPLKIEEKFKAKAIIDVFAYRGSKGLAALLIISLPYFSGTKIIPVLSLILMGIFSIWVYSVFNNRECFDLTPNESPVKN